MAMSSVFRHFNSFEVKRENAVKEVLVNTLSENLREVQYEAKQQGRDLLELSEATNSLCTTLEAIFLHGIKDSFLWQTINVIAGGEERRPEPSFWSPLLVFLHKQVIEQIQQLSQITSEIGQCRAWIRLSLNESLFSSYLDNMRKNASALSPYYKNSALLRDRDNIETAVKLMSGVEASIQFNLPINSSLLNHWPDYSLQLSGLWTPPLKSCPISSGIDIAESITGDTIAIPTPHPLRTNELFSESISNSPFTRTSNFAVEDLTQRENLDLFLQKVDEMDIIDEEDVAGAKDVSEHEKRPHTNLKLKIKHSKSREEERKVQADSNLDTSGSEFGEKSAPPARGNSLTNLMQTSWSSDFSDDTTTAGHFQRSVSMTSSATSLRSPTEDRCSYNALLKKHERNQQVSWTEVWEKFLVQNAATVSRSNSEFGVGGGGDMPAANTDEDSFDRGSNTSQTESDFELLTNPAFEKFDILELQEMVEQLCKLAQEPGLDVQGFVCKSCQHPLGIGYSNFRVCAFSGMYFCEKCMDVEPVLISAKIVYNWDFRKYYVSKRAGIFLKEFRCYPFIDLKVLNPDIYNASEAMAELQSLRIRLNFIRAYLYTCAPLSFEELQRQFFGREYLYEHIHQYSIEDLTMIQRGTLCQLLQKAYKMGEAHVLNCALCSLKGFICEICKSPRVLYPFHIDTTYRCDTCGAVFHAQCLNNHQACPKCERIRKRADNSPSSPREADNTAVA